MGGRGSEKILLTKISCKLDFELRQESQGWQEAIKLGEAGAKTRKVNSDHTKNSEIDIRNL